LLCVQHKTKIKTMERGCPKRHYESFIKFTEYKYKFVIVNSIKIKIYYFFKNNSENLKLFGQPQKVGLKWWWMLISMLMSFDNVY